MSEQETPRSPFTLLVDSPAVWQAMSADLAGATTNVAVQAMTFEGDSVGARVAEALLASSAPDRRVLIDSYTRVNQQDRWIVLPGAWFDRRFMDDVRRTARLAENLRAAGVDVRHGRPFGLLARRFLHRDHKKLILVDDRVSYLGGVNFAEHNFRWHDLMLRVEHSGLAEFLQRDFERSWDGRAAAEVRRFDDLNAEIHLLPGRRNRRHYRPLFDLVNGARASVWVVSPYVGPPFTDILGAAVRRGVRVGILTPEDNNKGYLRDQMLAAAARHGMQVRLYQRGMSHMKCVLIDDSVLLLGSSNFDLLSCNGFFAEVVAVCRDAGLVEDFRRMVLEPDLAASAPAASNKSVRGALREAPLRAAGLAARLLGGG